MVLALKYRPRVLADVVGQPVVVQTLSNAIKSKKLHHAYLLAGNLGCGKTSVARIVASSENCLQSPGLNPCGTCRVCSKIHLGEHADILEIDAASNAGKVEQVRELKNAASYRPIDGAKFKYFIIDECHRMSPSAGESVLKLIEEPPPSVRFILCTTELQQIKSTILSRCQVHEFKKIYWRQIAQHLENIIKQEQVQCDTDSLNLCAKLAAGSMRNALQNLQKVIDYVGPGQPITVSDTQNVFGAISDTSFYTLLDQVIGKPGSLPDASRGYRIINEMIANGATFNFVFDNIAEGLRNLLIGTTSSSCADLIMISDNAKSALVDQLGRCKSKMPAILESIQHLNNTKIAVEYGLSPELALQTWLINSIFAFQG